MSQLQRRAAFQVHGSFLTVRRQLGLRVALPKGVEQVLQAFYLTLREWKAQTTVARKMASVEWGFCLAHLCEIQSNSQPLKQRLTRGCVERGFLAPDLH